MVWIICIHDLPSSVKIKVICFKKIFVTEEEITYNNVFDQLTLLRAYNEGANLLSCGAMRLY